MRKSLMVLLTAILLVGFFLPVQYGTADAATSPSITWSTKTPMPAPSRMAASTTVGSKIYVVSGATTHCLFSASNEVYNTATNSWATLAPIPLPRVAFAVVAHENKLYAIAGSIDCSAQTTKSLGIYDISSNSWTTGASMSQQRWLHGGAIVGGKIYVMGGQSGTSGIKLDTLEIYDIATNSWSFGHPLLSGNQGRAAAIGSDIYFLGDDGVLQKYDTLSGIWSFKASWPNPFNIVAGGLEVYQNKLYAVSPPHYNYPGNTPIDDIKVDIYDPATNSWTRVEQTTPWATPRDAFATGIVGNSLFIIGGCNDGPAPSVVYDTNEMGTIQTAPCTLYDDFNDGDFTSNPAWYVNSYQGCAPHLGTVGVDNGELHVRQWGAGGCGQGTGIRRNLDIPIANQQATITFDVEVIYSSLSGSGHGPWEYPAGVEVIVEDANGVENILLIGYNYWGTCNVQGPTPGSEYVYVVGRSDAPQNTWLRGESFVIKDYLPTASKITAIRMSGGGWDYESRFDNVCLRVESGGQPQDTEPPTGVECEAPAYASATTSTSPQLTATPGQDESGPISYKFQLSDNESFDLNQGSTFVTEGDWVANRSYTMPVTLGCGTYWWRVKARDQLANEGDWSAYSVFFVARQVKDVAVIFAKYSDSGTGDSPKPIYPNIPDYRELPYAESVNRYYISNYASMGEQAFNFVFFDNGTNWYVLKTFAHYQQNYNPKTKPFPNDFCNDAIAEAHVNSSRYDTIIVVAPGNQAENLFTWPRTNGFFHNRVILTEGTPWPTWAHELGHTLGLPDLYQGSGFSRGEVYYWDLMGKGDKLDPPPPLSTYSRLWLGWFLEPQVWETGYGTRELSSLTSLGFHANAEKFIAPSSYLPPIPGLLQLGYIIEARDEQCGYPADPIEDGCLENGIVLYPFYKFAWGLSEQIGVVGSGSKTDPSLHPSNSNDPAAVTEYADAIALVKFTLKNCSTPGGHFQAELTVDAYIGELADMIGACLLSVLNIPSELGLTSPPVEAPDIDLHAYTEDGKHVGMNYDTGEYEIQIPGALASGDLVGGYEWIFVPQGASVRFEVSGHDLAEYAEELGLDPAEVSANCETAIISYDWDPHIEGGVIVGRDILSTATFELSAGEEESYPVADANGPYVCTEGSPIGFDGSLSYDPHGTIAQYNWDFGDGYIVVDNSTPTHAYGDNGVYAVTLTVTDDDGLTSTDTAEVRVNNTAPMVDTIIALTNPVAVNQPINAWGNFTDPGWLDTHTATWNWGDGTTSDGIVTETNGSGNVTGSHAYNCPGVYTIMLSVIDDDGDVGTATATVIVTPQAMKSFVIKNLAIMWAPHKPGWQGSDWFSIFGRLQLPQGYTWASLEKQATVTISIADESGNDIVVFKGQLVGRPQSALWVYKGSEQPPGEGMNITNMAMWWAPQGTKWAGWGGFYIGGVIQLPEPIGINTTPANVRVTLEIPLMTTAGCGSLVGQQTVPCKVYKTLNLWTYNVWPNLPTFPYDATGRE